MDFINDYMPEPEPSNISTADIINFYNRFGDKKLTAERYCISVKELNAILKAVNKNKQNKSDPYDEIGMSRMDFL